MEYIVIKSNSIQGLINEVNKSIIEGFNPLGSLSVVYTGYTNSPIFYQAMTK